MLLLRLVLDGVPVLERVRVGVYVLIYYALHPPQLESVPGEKKIIIMIDEQPGFRRSLNPYLEG
mgnify:CR=1 FL=1